MLRLGTSVPFLSEGLYMASCLSSLFLILMVGTLLFVAALTPKPELRVRLILAAIASALGTLVLIAYCMYN